MTPRTSCASLQNSSGSSGRAGLLMRGLAHFTARKAFYQSLRLPLRRGVFCVGSFRPETRWKLAWRTLHWIRMLTTVQTHFGHSLEAPPMRAIYSDLPKTFSLRDNPFSLSVSKHCKCFLFEAVHNTDRGF